MGIMIHPKVGSEPRLLSGNHSSVIYTKRQHGATWHGDHNLEKAITKLRDVYELYVFFQRKKAGKGKERDFGDEYI